VPIPRRDGIAAALLSAAAVAIGACSGADGDERAAQQTPSGASASAAGLPDAMSKNVKQGDRIVGEGLDDFKRRLRQLRGHPVVVNQWASWCTSCRFEFPFFAEMVNRYRAEVAFVGLDSQDERGAAEDFMTELPVGFPSIFDPDAEVAAAYGGGQAWPTTMFFDADGELVNVKIGAYATADLLQQDIQRWALDNGS
jgi:cytochrome c biogenesis protein CcmG, thiol:disulfide interchange protein DsbE